MHTAQPAGRVRLNVGGQVFETTVDTLTGAGEGTMLCAMMDPCWNAAGAAGTAGGVPEYFIDRDPACFASLLDMLRTGELHVPAGVPERVLFREANYYGLLDRVRAARIGELDLERVRLAASVPPGRVTADRPIVRAAPDGGCCVTHTHDTTVRVYNWMLEERRPETKMFASCRGISRYDSYGIGVWDCITGEQAGPLSYPKPESKMGSTTKLQWLPNTKTLMAASVCSSFSMALVDSRDMSVVWSWWYDSAREGKNRCVVDAAVMEDERSVCLISDHHDLGLLDIRIQGNSGNVRWLHQSKMSSTSKCNSPKLAVHGGLLLASKDDTISVFGGPKYDLRLALRGSQGGGAINDFSVGGDRLFAVHKEDNVLDVWETPLPPII
ncbi:BTB/POZ domain-containing protein At2g24240-like [Triticum dicoccoides]|uniref:BTB/POZ domain-containing protein At2g24240-like n=1 Tax=Triticum dicoccoides TaxID=85692 RepID=UPI001891C63B|nr:BTB/POZ domain-containing protein At2g24240-like [Triticum dicoccoides]